MSSNTILWGKDGSALIVLCDNDETVTVAKIGRYGYGSEHTLKKHLYEWAKHLHGNPPSGTPYWYVVLDGRRYVCYI